MIGPVGLRQGRRVVGVKRPFRALVVWTLLVLALPTTGAESVIARAIQPEVSVNGVIITDSGLVLPVREAGQDGFLVTTPCSREGFVENGAHLSDIDIVLDPGHGGSETGYIGREGVPEKDLNLAVAKKAAVFLQSRGYSVLLTRTTDVRLPTVVRAEIARSVDAKVFVSIHHNGGTTRRSQEPGTEMYHQAGSPDSKRLAGILFEEVRGALSQYDISWRETALQGANAIVRRRDRQDLYGVLRHSRGIPAVITEALYLSNHAEEVLIMDPEVQAVEASAIADGIVRYLTTTDPGSGYNGTIVSSRILTSGGASGCVDPALEAGTFPASDTVHFRGVTGAHLTGVEWLAGEGVLAGTGCGSEHFCPHAPLERWALAVWLVRALGHTDLVPVSFTRFGDLDAGRWWAPYVERLADLGITRGCASEPVRYCPHATVTRGELATFLTRAFNLTAETDKRYADVTGHPHFEAISVLTGEGLSGPCGVNPLRYCPDHPVIRAHGAIILAGAKALYLTREDLHPAS